MKIKNGRGHHRIQQSKPWNPSYWNREDFRLRTPHYWGEPWSIQARNGNQGIGTAFGTHLLERRVFGMRKWDDTSGVDGPLCWIQNWACRKKKRKKSDWKHNPLKLREHLVDCGTYGSHSTCNNTLGCRFQFSALAWLLCNPDPSSGYTYNSSCNIKIRNFSNKERKQFGFFLIVFHC